MIRHCAIALVVSILGICLAFPLTDEEIFRDFRFNFINPGARSLALGGAFTSLADDATAAQANPAGLAYLRTQEYFIELRSVDNAGRTADVQDSFGGANISVLTGSQIDDARNITFASAVFPAKEVMLAVSRQVVLSTEATTLNSFSFEFTGQNPGTSTIQAAGSLDVMQVNYNASAGFRLNDQVTLGLSVVYARLDVNSAVQSLVFDPSGNIAGYPIPAPDPNDPPLPVLQPTTDLQTTIDDQDTDFGFTVGALFKPSERFSVGAVYRKAPKFTVTEEIVPGGLDVFGVQAAVGGSTFENHFNVPDSYGIGGSWRPLERLLFALDIEHVEYSDLVDGYVPGINTLTGVDAVFTAENATDYRLGFEYYFPLKNQVILAPRAGLFTQSDNTISAVFTGSGGGTFATPSSFEGQDREVHGTIGLGLGFGRQQIDIGVELGSSENEFLVSYIFKGKEAAH